VTRSAWRSTRPHHLFVVDTAKALPLDQDVARRLRTVNVLCLARQQTDDSERTQVGDHRLGIAGKMLRISTLQNRTGPCSST
jgi:hypothetical protein